MNLHELRVLLNCSEMSQLPEASQTSTTRFRTIDDLFEEASNKLVSGSLPREPSFNIHLDSPVRESREKSMKSKEREDLPLLATDITSLAELECMRNALRSICDTKGALEGRLCIPTRIVSYLSVLRCE